MVAEVVEAAEEVVEQPHQLRRRLVRTHLGEAHDVREQDAHVLHRVHVERPEDVPDVTLQRNLEVLRVHNVIYNEGRPLSRDVLFCLVWKFEITRSCNSQRPVEHVKKITEWMPHSVDHFDLLLSFSDLCRN